MTQYLGAKSVSYSNYVLFLGPLQISALRLINLSTQVWHRQRKKKNININININVNVYSTVEIVVLAIVMTVMMIVVVVGNMLVIIGEPNLLIWKQNQWIFIQLQYYIFWFKKQNLLLLDSGGGQNVQNSYNW